jgi:transposase-like protein
MNCPKCQCAEAVKNGTKNQKQRYKCKLCGCNYTQSSTARIPLESRVKAIKLYLEGVGFRGIERLTGIHHTTVIKWVKNLALVIERLRPELSEQVMTVELDEMWHFIQKKHKNAGSGWRGTENANAAVVCS